MTSIESAINYDVSRLFNMSGCDVLYGWWWWWWWWVRECMNASGDGVYAMMTGTVVLLT